MILPVVTIKKGKKEKKWIKTKIGVGSIAKENVGYIEDDTREERIRKTRKEVVGCV